MWKFVNEWVDGNSCNLNSVSVPDNHHKLVTCYVRGWQMTRPNHRTALHVHKPTLHNVS